MAHGARCSTCGIYRSCSGVCGNCDAERRQKAKKEKTVTEFFSEEAQRLGQDALRKILEQCSCQICRVMRMAERPFG